VPRCLARDVFLTHTPGPPGFSPALVALSPHHPPSSRVASLQLLAVCSGEATSLVSTNSGRYDPLLWKASALFPQHSRAPGDGMLA
jgi:hypothetical protein